jgi:acetylornithine deacetylase/succinyl-diaminopimelate desuccinylase-like protein
VVTPYLVPFSTDSNEFRQKGVKAYGFGSAIVNASIVASMHSDAERIPVDQFTPALRIYYRAVAGYLTQH